VNYEAKEYSAYKSILRNFNLILGVNFILIVSIIYIVFIFNVDFSSVYNDIDSFFYEEASFYLRIIFSFLIPIGVFLFTFLFTLNPVSVKSVLLSFFFIFLLGIYSYKLQYGVLLNDFLSKNSAILAIRLIFAYLLMIFAAALAYIRYDFKKLNLLYDFYTMAAEIILWSFLIFFVDERFAS